MSPQIQSRDQKDRREFLARLGIAQGGAANPRVSTTAPLDVAIARRQKLSVLSAEPESTDATVEEDFDPKASMVSVFDSQVKNFTSFSVPEQEMEEVTKSAEMAGDGFDFILPEG